MVLRSLKLWTFGFLITQLLLLSCSQKYIKRDSLSREIALTKVFVFPFIDSDGEESKFSEYAQEEVINIVNGWRKFKVIPFSDAKNFLEKQSFFGNDYTKVETLGSIWEKTRADAVIVGVIDNDDIEISLYSTISGVLFFRVSESVSDELNVHSVKAISNLLLKRIFHYIPFDALVIKRAGDKVKINAGRANGLAQGSKLTVFDIDSYRYEEERIEYQKIPIASLKVISLNRNSAICRVLKHNRQFPIQKYNKVSFMDFFINISEETKSE